MKKILILLAFCLTAGLANAQMSGQHYRQFFYNPYLFNPAYVTKSKETTMFLTYRQQWFGFRDAPSVGAFNFIIPTSEKVHLAFNVYSDKQLLVRNTGFMTTFGYTVPFSEKQSLRFGLTAGIGQNKLDLTAEELNTNDPVITRAASSNYFIDGNVGLVYVYDRLEIGAAMVSIFNNKSFSTNSFNELELSDFGDRIYSVSYTQPLGKFKRYELEAYGLYQESVDDIQDYWEVGSIFYYDEKFWLGGSYNSYAGIGAYLGVDFNRFSFSYAYEFPTIGNGAASGHELMMSFTLPNVGHKPKMARPNTPKPILKPLPIPKEMPIKKDSVFAPITKPYPPIGKVEETPKENIVYYVTIAVFKDEPHVENYITKLKLDYEIAYFKNFTTEMYYVYISSGTNLEEAKKIREEIIQNPEHKDAWIFSQKN